ncbi:MAG: DUF2341 domain-containing protein [Terriglobales bacterium]
MQAEYNNQSSPSTFFAFSPEADSSGSLNPLAVTLYQSQSQQFTVLETGSCNAGGATWSMPSGSPGTLSPSGLYTSPATINTQQNVTITASTLGTGSTPLTASITLMPPVAMTVSPGSSTLPAGGTEQLTARVTNTTNTAVSWSIDPAGTGTVSPSGLFTAPATLNGQQTVSVIATSQADPTQSASATVLVVPNTSTGPAIAVNPPAVTLSAGQAEQFNATVTNAGSTSVTWSISPSGTGVISDSGLYTAPETIASQETVTITATSQTNPALSASAMVTLTATQCASTGYGYQRVVVIDHTKVYNTDQINFPFLFNTTDPDLATVGNGGHVTNSNGYDIIFSTDPNGQTRLDFEIEQYNPATGQVVAWIRIPTLSHTSDTIIYVFYGNPSITVSQANPSGVWDSNYQAVYHLGNLPATDIASDSTNYANNAPFTNFTASPGLIDGAASLDGISSFLQIPSTAFPSYPISVIPSSFPTSASGNGNSFSATFGIWFKTTGWGGLLDQTSGEGCEDTFLCALLLTPEQPGEVPFGSWAGLLDINFNGQLTSRGATTTQTYNDNNWHYAVVTYQNGVGNLYADGQPVGSGQSSTFGYSPTYAYFVGTADVETDDSTLDSQPWKYLPGQVDEINVSSIARSGDWTQTQYNNQSSPSTFYTFYSPNAVQVAPSSISLYASQSEQFAVPATCDATITWSLPAGSPGTLTAGGLYTAPSAISTQQSVTVSATSQSNNSSLGSAQVTLLPAPRPLTLVASSPSPYQVGATHSFTATLLDLQNNPLSGVAINFTVAGPNESVGAATTNASGTASFTYTGANSGTDTVQATASVDGSLIASNSLTAAWLTPPPAQVPTLTLLPQPNPGRGALVGAFTDNNGDVIEPIVVGTAVRTFITPTGATRLQLGINSTYYANNGGSGFVVLVNGVKSTVPPKAMPWNWQTGGLNNNYQYGVNDGSDPVVAAASLTAGQPVTVAYQRGTVSSDYPINPLVNANGESDFVTGTQEFQGAYFPTLYTTGTNYPQNQPISEFAVATDSTGAPIANAQVTLSVSGANPGQYQATTDTTGTASFLYTGQYAGNDSLQAQATVTGQGTLSSAQTAIDWINYPTPPTVGSLSLNFINNSGSAQNFSAFAKDASGNVLTNVNVGLYVTGVDNFQTSTSTNNIGQAYFSYNHSQSGNYSVFAVDTVDRNVIVTSPYTGSWTTPPGSSSTTAGTITIGISANTTVTMPHALQLNGTVTDSSGQTPSIIWNEVTGPGTVTFANPNQSVTTATFSEVGTYVVQLAAADSVNSGSVQFTVTVNAPSVASQSQGWIGSPIYGSAVSGVVPITLAPGVTIANGTLSYMPTNNVNSVSVLNANVLGTGQIGAFDATSLANGSYWIQMQATDTNGNQSYSLVLVTVTGNYKPGRVTTTVTDLVVPATGLPIQIQRTYDSLNAGTVGDFGYGWNLGINVDLSVDPSGNVTFTLGGQRRTFYLTPQAPPCTIAGCLFPYYFVAFTPEPGLHGTLTDSSQGCPLDLVMPYGSLWECYGGTGQYEPPGYIYTDPTGTQYNISASGALQSVTDRNSNGFTITPNGITSTTGLNVPFVRDSQGRIAQITDPQGNVYLYGYDVSGNLATVNYPNTPHPSTYTYNSNHLYLSGTDFRNDPLPVTTYYDSTNDDGNSSLDGRVASVTDGLGETTSYAYNLSTNTITTTYPPIANGNVGHSTMVYDSLGDLISSTDPLNLTTTNTFDINQDLLSTTDPLGHTTSYSYDANGNKTSQTYPATATTTNTTSTTNYNQYSEPNSTTDELGNVRTFNYDANYNPASVTDSLGTVASFQFNANGTLAAGATGYDITQAPSRASQFTYDADGDLTGKTDALGRTISYTYNSLGQKITMTEPVPAGSSAAAATTTYTYDAFGNVTQTQAPLGRITNSQYDGNGNKTSDTDARSNTTQYQYDNLNRLVETDYPDGTKATKTYDFRNNVVTETDQGGHITLHQYDISGRQVAVTMAYGTANATTTTYAYDNAGRRTSETDALGHVTNYTYDAAGNLLSVAGVAGNFSYAYDNARNEISMTDGDGNTTQYQYDARKRLIVTTYPDQTTSSDVYDGAGNVISTTDQAGNQIQYTYDAANELTSAIQVDSPNSPANTNVYGYDVDGNVITLDDANSHTTAKSFDLLNEPIATTLPDGTLTESRTYDQNGNLATVTHFNGAITTYTYDQLNRLLSRATPGETTVSHTYTPTGKYGTTTDASGTTTYTYDTVDRITAKATPEGTLNYTYDAAGHVASIQSSNASGANVGYTYDDLNRLSTVVDNRLGSTTSYSYDTANNLATVTYPNGVQSTFTFDTLNRIAGLNSQPASYSYQRGPTGNLTGATELNGRTESWSYDGIYRLTNETISLDPSHANGTVIYGLDPVGNRLTEASSLADVPSGSFGYNADDELSSESYDLNGNVIASGRKTFTYDSQNELVSMNGSGTAVVVVYDGFGNRVSKTVNGVTTKYLVEDDVNPTGRPQVFDELTNGLVTRTYTYGLQRIDEEQIVSNQWRPSFYGYDGGGNVRQLTNAVGAITDTFEYDAFGNEVNHTGTTANNYLYRGEQFDPDLDLYYLRARYYNPLAGRFTGVDPLTDQGEKRYEYADADPVDGQDPTGTEDLTEYRPLMAGSPPKLPIRFPTWCEGNSTAANLPGCGGKGARPAPPPAPPPPPCCFAQLKYRAVMAGRNHAFWYVTDASGENHIVDAGPADPGCSPWHRCGLLIDWPPFGPNVGHYPEDVPGDATAWNAPQSSNLCNQVAGLLTSATNWNSQHTNTWYKINGSPNSNTFAHELANDVGFTNVTAPPSAPGW